MANSNLFYAYWILITCQVVYMDFLKKLFIKNNVDIELYTYHIFRDRIHPCHQHPDEKHDHHARSLPMALSSHYLLTKGNHHSDF